MFPGTSNHNNNQNSSNNALLGALASLSGDASSQPGLGSSLSLGNNGPGSSGAMSQDFVLPNWPRSVEELPEDINCPDPFSLLDVTQALPQSLGLDSIGSQVQQQQAQAIHAAGYHQVALQASALHASLQQQLQLLSQLPQQDVPLLSQTQPSTYGNDGSAIYVVGPQSSVDMAGLVGHRVVALPAEIIQPMTLLVSLDGSNTSASAMSARPASSSILMPSQIPQVQQSLSADSLSYQQWTQLPHSAAVSFSQQQQQAQHLQQQQLLQRQLPGFRGGRSRAGGRGRAQGRHQLAQGTGRPTGSTLVRAAAPTWAGADWNPRAVQQGSSSTTATGTGVFIPKHLQPGANVGKAPTSSEQGKDSGPGSSSSGPGSSTAGPVAESSDHSKPSSHESLADSLEALPASLFPALNYSRG
mmetsp:Transcript_3374/g.7380  ORF Transcript_3374/g.7380 Transcript_3374/m.7380 type:complete len:414 (+) Transcript_3374:147-1388(+)|eukprot:CAMPEP_0202889928 /NCGR_PEP_ID=MMETSP1392-20130828/466_1 /ASSEMBLY_ACC=CAM_ASM_000868 /TAXON_ID=225041 /ORGANISM="Chlamydomonas chlamydogama, Strain SAG 11-48b" /LENGTH=413 /DNA_ID=CAMNT_0049573377 /DNA_START=125 /DNA_END=1366 /DNA_ORIENTATION=+